MDAREEFAAAYCVPALMANALYMDKLPAGLGPVPAADRRPPGPRRRREGRRAWWRTAAPARATTRCASRSGWLACSAGLTVLAPVRDSGMTRDKAIAFAAEKGLPIDGPRARPTRSTRTCGAARSRPATWRTSGTPRRRTLRLHLRPGRAAGARRAGAVVRRRRAGRHRRAGAEPARDHHRAERPGRGAGHRAPGHGGGPAGGHQEPGDLRGARRHRADRRAFRARERMPRARPGPVQAAGGAALVRAGLRRPVVLSAQARARRLHRRGVGAGDR